MVWFMKPKFTISVMLSSHWAMDDNDKPPPQTFTFRSLDAADRRIPCNSSSEKG
eukprot:CAMPEP_0115755890 /NCGR_PEP_ID=MMETSP0272-20121206/97625_1 /TAXON_ID=71861 /ORGANISM="Scrippsiella trochoidea, Strain CCMP3099" /LENGTH=53 /DNA_ID=CAMNT_0003201355 /DNA_START=14 /DNA_END=175 /DNA_ORIENTATION=-